MIYGQPGSGKSTFVEWLMNQMDVPTLYFSADMDATDAISRLGAQRMGWTVDTVKDAIQNGGIDFISSELEGSKIQWCFDADPTLDDIADELDAYVETWDQYPTVIVVDNAMNVEGEAEDEHGGLRFVLKELHRLAHSTGIAVFVLHHAREEGNPSYPPPRAQLQGKVSQLPEIALGVALADGEYRIAVTKHRSGKQDAAAKSWVTLMADAERANFTGFVPPQYRQTGTYA